MVSTRRRNRLNPYRILISEVMLQQTQVSRVLEKYPEFLRRFPALSALAQASQRDVVMAWQGMGYNNRAIRLHKLARRVMSEHGGRFPNNIEALISLPGIGKYTAHAVLCSAFGQHLPVVDTNVRRVLSRVFQKMPTTGDLHDEADIWNLAERLLPRGRAYDWNQALMDLGATICTARRPNCHDCPVASACASRAGMQWATVRLAKREPSRNGIPNRIYRGRVIQELRTADRAKNMSIVELGKRILGRPADGDRQWWGSLLAGLERDGLIKIRESRTLTRQRVALA